MMMNSKKILFTITLVLLVSNTIFAQWNKGKGNGYYKLSAWYLEADKHYTDEGKKDPNVTRSQFNISFYGDYGVTDKLDVIAYIPFFSRAVAFDDISGASGQVLMEGEAFNSIGDLLIGMRYGVLKTNKYALSVSLKLGLPTGNDAGGSDGSFQTGDGEFNQLLQVHIGRSLKIGTIRSYAKAYVGFNNRTNDFSDELSAGFELGANLSKNKLWLLGRASILESLKNGSLSAQTAQGSIFANNIEYINLGAEISYYITKKLGVSFSFTSAVAGELIYAAPSYSGGVFLVIK